MSEPQTEAGKALLQLLNALGIVGPNIPHRLLTDKDKADPKAEEWMNFPDDGFAWCVCGRVMPCEAAVTVPLIAAIEAQARDAALAEAEAAVKAEQAAAPKSGSGGYWKAYHDGLNVAAIAIAALRRSGGAGSVPPAPPPPYREPDLSNLP